MMSIHNRFHRIRNPLWRRVPVIMTVIAVVAVATVAFYANKLFVASTQPLHGPHPNSARLLGSDSPAPPIAATDPRTSSLQTMTAEPQLPSPVQSGYGIAGGGGLTHLSQSELDEYFAALKELGVEWLRWDVDWGAIQPTNETSFEWDGTDRVADTAQKFGIKSLAVATYTPQWARLADCRDTEMCRPADPAAFGRFAGVAAQRYQGKIDHWEIWNEPNYTLFWQPRPSVTDYAALLKAAHTAIKTVNPKATVLAGGLASSGDEDDGSIAPITFVRELYAQGLQPFFDGLTVHPYTYPARPTHQAWWNRWQQIQPIRELMVTQLDEAKKVWITEYGAPTDGPGVSFAAGQTLNFSYGNDFVNEDSQQQLASEAIEFYQTHRSWMGPFFWYNLKDTNPSRSTPENFFGLIRYDGSKKPAYTVIKEAINKSH